MDATPAGAPDGLRDVAAGPYEGPLDLLLHLIRREHIDIFDIPIARITEQYLAAVEVMRGLQLDVASDFLVMAATLVHLKSRFLLPPDVRDDEEDEDAGLDPRDALRRKLLELARFQDAAVMLHDRAWLDRDVWARGMREPLAPADDSLPFQPVDVWRLISSLADCLSRAKEGVREITRDRITIAERIQAVLEVVRERSTFTFMDLVERAGGREEIVVTFLAVLELAKMHVLKLQQLGPGRPIHISRAVEEQSGLAGPASGPARGLAYGSGDGGLPGSFAETLREFEISSAIEAQK